MRNFLLKVCALMWVSCSAFAASATYQLDPYHSYVEWHISHFGYSNPTGKWYANGTIIYDEAQPQNTKINVTIKVGDIVTGLPELDDHLRKPLFFDVTKFPLATFVSNKVTMTGKETAKVAGMLTLHGVTKPVVLKVKLNKIGLNFLSGKYTLGATASTLLKRSDFDMMEFLPGLGDDVKIDIEIEAFKVS